MANDKRVKLYGRVFITGDIRTVTGLHIGMGKQALAIGGVDAPVIRDPLTNLPYIPGSSLRGKMRSLMEKKEGVRQEFYISRKNDVRIHVCETAVDEKKKRKSDNEQPYNTCPVCPIFGVPGDKYANAPTRLIVRDVSMDPESKRRLEDEAKTDLPYTEVKWEASIDRVTSMAVPRQMERVPADTVFNGFEFVFNIFEAKDRNRLRSVLEAMLLVEDDYLGGLGSRGSGKIKFENLRIYARSSDNYGTPCHWKGKKHAFASVSAALVETEEPLSGWLSAAMPIWAGEGATPAEEVERPEEPGVGVDETPGEE